MNTLKCVLQGELTLNAHAGQPFLMSQLRTSWPSAVLTLLCSLHCTSEKLSNACEKSGSIEWLYLIYQYKWLVMWGCIDKEKCTCWRAHEAFMKPWMPML